MPDTAPLRVLLVDDDRLALDALERGLRREPTVLVDSRAIDAATAEAIALRRRPDVVLLDVMMPGASAWDACRRIVDETEARVLMCTGFLREDFVYRAQVAGAAGILSKRTTESLETLVSVIHFVAAGNDYYGPEWQARLDKLKADGRLDAVEQLTDRQVMILDLLPRHSAAEIAEQLGVPLRTVQRDLAGARTLFGVESDKELVLKAAFADVIQPTLG